MKAKELLMKARAGLVLDQPFYASILFRLETREDPSTPTIWTDGKTIGYNPTFIEALTLETVKGILAHEVSHIVFLHHLRRKSRDPETWNKAADYAINSVIEKAGFKLPPERLRSTNFDGKATDEIFGTLWSRKPAPSDSPDAPPQETPGEGSEKPAPPKNPDPGKTGEIRDYPDQTPAGIKQAEQEIKVSIQQAATYAKKHGRLPADLETYLEELLNPALPWREILARFIDQSSRNDYTWNRPNPRYMARGLYLPALQAPELGRVVLAVDTSGSIEREEIRTMVSEIKGILHAFPGSELTVIYCNTRIVKDPETLTQHDDIGEIPRPGGGTDFRPPFTWTREKQIEPKALIYFTDGECSSFPKPEDVEFPVLWVLTQKVPACYGWNPPVGETAHFNRQEENAG